jgi:AraC family transcriptional regulator
LQNRENEKNCAPKHLSRISLVRSADRQALPEHPFASVVLSSACTNWCNVVVEQHNFRTRELADLMFVKHVIAVNIGPLFTCEFKKEGRFQRIAIPPDAISLVPSQWPFSRRSIVDENASADAVLLALDPVFVDQTAASLEVYPDCVELVEQKRETDPALWHIASALLGGMQACHAADILYGECLSTALAIHLLRQYGGIAVRPQRSPRGLAREKLMRAVDYIQDQLHTDLTVADIAKAIHISPYHFTRLFKSATGQSPYRYVMEARAKRAKELLTSRKFSISQVAHQVGFADQSHLTHHVKRFYGVTPKMLLDGQI